MSSPAGTSDTDDAVEVVGIAVGQVGTPSGDHHLDPEHGDCKSGNGERDEDRHGDPAASDQASSQIDSS